MINSLDEAKALAYDFLSLKMEETDFSPLVVYHPFFENGCLMDEDGLFNALEDCDRFDKYKEEFYKKRIVPCKSIQDIVSCVRKSYKLTYINYLYDIK